MPLNVCDCTDSPNANVVKVAEHSMIPLTGVAGSGCGGGRWGLQTAAARGSASGGAGLGCAAGQDLGCGGAAGLASGTGWATGDAAGCTTRQAAAPRALAV